MIERRPSRLGHLRYAGALVVLALLWFSMLLWGRGPADQAIYSAVYAGGHPALVAIARVFTAIGDPAVLIGLVFGCALWLWYAGHRHLPFVLIAVTMLGRGLAEVQKYEIARARPDLEPHLVVVKTSSFPSGHATSSMIFFLTLALALTVGSRWRHGAVAAAILLSLLVGASRVMLGVHWPSDVVGGWSFGMLWVLVTLRIARRFVERDLIR
jgi:undecaprenyl-diphosphatase